ncbi:class I SAM-dependent methyltransferase [Synechocystis salina LEGE 06099]|uniref:class I SAM-dependent methyltransferase n=1 Tax=Synechocystis salina TaxID=945780 RepID=UPI001880FDA7|nr:class I SAM-dependent methyltransferase [Synechocystis salina]MBE9204802.1 class I SAM-dependent methyltransferase [Synechocystis salina LEGE 06099]
MSKSPRNRLIHILHDKALEEVISRHCQGKLIDIGCGTKPYQALLAPYITEHIGVDHQSTLHDKSNIDLFGTAYQIPADDDSFDSAICTAVLEHLEEPELALKECYRVLKPGGFAIYSVPFIWHLHEEPRDFYRFTKYGLKYLFEKVGFEIIEIKALSGFWVTFGQLFVYNLYRYNRSVIKWTHIIDGIGLLIQGIVYVLDKLDKTEQWTWMYIIIARKRESDEIHKS